MFVIDDSVIPGRLIELMREALTPPFWGAGTRLDSLITVLYFGAVECPGNYFSAELTEDPRFFTCENCGFVGFPQELSTSHPVPRARYSSDLPAAWQLVEMLADLGWCCEVSLLPEGFGSPPGQEKTPRQVLARLSKPLGYDLPDMGAPLQLYWQEGAPEDLPGVLCRVALRVYQEQYVTRPVVSIGPPSIRRVTPHES